MRRIDEVEAAVRVLQDDGLVGFSTTAGEFVFCDASNPLAAERLRRLELIEAALQTSPVVLLPSIPGLKDLIPALPPRIETLLAYHKRPLTVLSRDWQNLPLRLADPEGRISFQLDISGSFRAIFELFAHPLAIQEWPSNPFSRDTIEMPVDAWIRAPLIHSPDRTTPVVRVEYTDQGELLFV